MKIHEIQSSSRLREATRKEREEYKKNLKYFEFDGSDFNAFSEKNKTNMNF
jgi:hypothetical protein